MDDFTLRALISALTLAVVMGPLGAFVVWRQMAYFGDTIAHAALLGVSLSLITSGVLPISLSIFLIAVGVALTLGRYSRDTRFHADTLLGILAHGALALGILLVSLSKSVRVDVNAYLFGDILTIGWSDVYLLLALAAVVLILLRLCWRPLLMVTIDPAIAKVEGIDIARTHLILTLILATVIAFAIKITGVLLITAMLIMPAGAARYFSTTPKQMALLASLIGMFNVSLGLFTALKIDAPTGPTMVVIAMLAFLFCGGLAGLRKTQ